MKINKIAIRFGDNDFHSTFKGVLALLKDANEYGGLDLSKENLCLVINNLSPIAYLTHQNQFEYNGLQDYKNSGNVFEALDFERTKIWLNRLTPERLLINEEVDKYLKEGNAIHFFNGETFIYDSTLYNNQIYSV